VVLSAGIPQLLAGNRTWAALLWNTLHDYHRDKEADLVARWLRGEVTVDRTARALRALEADL